MKMPAWVMRWGILAVAGMWSVAGSVLAAGEDGAGQYLAAGVGYVSAVRLAHQPHAPDNGRLLVVFEPSEPGGIPLYESHDHGDHWHKMGEIQDQVHAGMQHWQLRWQPHLSELSRASGDLLAGTLLLAANAIEVDGEGHAIQQELQLYISRDGGRRWEYRSRIIQGRGRPIDPLNQGVWEPYLVLLDDSRLLAFYSSEQHKIHGFNQLLAHKVSLDGGRSWGEEIVNTAFPGGVERPGMSVVEQIPGQGYVMVYENIDGERNGQIYMKRSRDGMDWGRDDARGVGIQTAAGAWPAACPSVRWLPGETAHGILLVAAQRAGGGGDGNGHTLYRNDNGGQGPWWEMAAPVRKVTGNIHAGWTQAMLAREDGTLLHITSSSNPTAPTHPGANEILFAAAALALSRYEAENAERHRGAQIGDASASLGRKVRLASGADAALIFDIQAGRTEQKRLLVRYAPIGFMAQPMVEMNGEGLSVTSMHAGTAGDDVSGWRIAEFTVSVRAGDNRIILSNPVRPLDYDYIEIHSLEP